MHTLLFLNRVADVERSANRLPHWEQPERCYFITFRMADSIPADLRREWTEQRVRWLAKHPQPHSANEMAEYQQKFTARIERWLDYGHGSCVLQRPDCREVVDRALQYFEGQRYHLHACVVMPNHVHVLTSLLGGSHLAKVLSSWKSYTANILNEHLGLQGAFWQEDYFDRIVRDSEHFVRCVRYIRRNPAKAHLTPDQYTHWEDDLCRQWAPSGEGSS